MTLNIQLSPEIEARLLEKAALTGEAPEQLVLRAVESQFGATPKKKKLSTEEWIKWLRSWAASHPPVDHFVDDSRESIY